MLKLLTWIGGLLGIDVGSGFLVLVQRLTVRWVLITAAVVAAVFAWNALRLLINQLATTAQTYLATASGESEFTGQVLAWVYCILPASTGDAFATIFSAAAASAALNFYWQVLKLKGGGF